MILGLEADDTDDLRIGIAFAKFASGDAVLGEVGGIGCRTVLFRIAVEVFDLDLRPLFHLAVMGHILAAAVFQMMNDSLQFHIVFCFLEVVQCFLRMKIISYFLRIFIRFCEENGGSHLTSKSG